MGQNDCYKKEPSDLNCLKIKQNVPQRYYFLDTLIYLFSLNHNQPDDCYVIMEDH